MKISADSFFFYSKADAGTEIMGIRLSQMFTHLFVITIQFTSTFVQKPGNRTEKKEKSIISFSNGSGLCLDVGCI